MMEVMLCWVAVWGEGVVLGRRMRMLGWTSGEHRERVIVGSWRCCGCNWVVGNVEAVGREELS